MASEPFGRTWVTSAAKVISMLSLRPMSPSLFIAEALDLCLAKKYSVSEEMKEDFRRLGLEAIEDEIDLRARQAVGLCLGRVGGPRIFHPHDPRAYGEVPAGTYPYRYKGERIGIGRPPRLGRYPGDQRPVPRLPG